MSNSTSMICFSKATVATFGDTDITIYSQTCISDSARSLQLAGNAYERNSSGKDVKYMICTWVKAASDKVGEAVVKLPEDYKGFSDESEDDGFERIGILLKNTKTKKWYVESDVVVLEKVRRASEVEKMKAGRLSIGEFKYNHEAYLEYLSGKDKEALGGMHTRGYSAIY